MLCFSNFANRVRSKMDGNVLTSATKVKFRGRVQYPNDTVGVDFTFE